jgi:hypothetical protein
MVKKSKLFKLLVSLGIKGVLCIICLASIATALVTYSTAITANPTVQLTQGATSATWTLYVNEVDQVRYLPGGFSEPTLSTGNTATYSFKVVTDGNKVCAVKVALDAAVDNTKFSQFDITVRSSTGSDWGPETIYSASTGTSTKDSINGLTLGDAAYIHQTTFTTKYYEVKVTYSYDLLDDNSAVPITLRLTPLPQDSFT